MLFPSDSNRVAVYRQNTRSTTAEANIKRNLVKTHPDHDQPASTSASPTARAIAGTAEKTRHRKASLITNDNDTQTIRIFP